MANVNPKIWKSFCEKDARWMNAIKRCVNEDKEPKSNVHFEWDEVAQWYYDRLKAQKKAEEENMIKQYGRILFPVSFEMTESDTVSDFDD